MHHRNQAVGGAAGVRDDVVRAGVVLLVIHPVDNGDVLLLARSRDYDLLRAGLQVVRGGVAVGEPSRGLEHHVHSQVLPRQLRRILLRQHLHFVAIDDDGALGGLDIAIEAAMHRIVFQQVRQGLRIGEVVHCHEVQLSPTQLLCRPDHVSTDAPEPIDSNPYCHVPRPSEVVVNPACSSPASLSPARCVRGRRSPHQPAQLPPPAGPPRQMPAWHRW